MIDFGTWLYTKLRGEHVGTDQQGNRYYRRKKPSGRVASLMHERRWVLYKDCVEASKVPAEWHVWLHHTSDETLDEAKHQRFDWQKDHQPNHTGTDLAYRPPGHGRLSSTETKSASDYESWTPS